MMRMRNAGWVLIAVVLGLFVVQPASATPLSQTHFDFRLDKREVAKDEPVVARYQLTRPAKRVFITATNVEGGPLSFIFPQTITVNSQRTGGVITFTVPVSAGTLSPLQMTLNVDGQLRGLNTLGVACDYLWFFDPRPDRCLFAPPTETPAAIQRFERGVMIWLERTKSIYVLQEPNGLVDRFDDTFVDGMPETDGNIKPPAGKLQPVRGFGTVWRSHPRVMTALGWAMDPERGYTACTGQSFGGTRNIRTYITTPKDHVVEIATNYEPFAWRAIHVAALKPCK